jgi:phage/plasmid-like protein (TIGR03299 family)
VRDNPATGRPEVLGVVGESYRPIQNEEHADLLDTLVDESGAHFETAGSLRGGRQVFLTMRLPKTIRIGGVDSMGTYLAALNSHDGSLAFRLLVTPVRIVCANTQAAALRRARSSFSIHHTSGARGQIQAAREALGLTFAYMDAFQAEAERMLGQAMTEAQFVAITRSLWPVEDGASARTRSNAARRESSLRHLFVEGDTNATIRGTRWAAYQTVTEYLDHYAPVDGARDAATVRAERVVSGQTNELKSRAFDLLRA